MSDRIPRCECEHTAYAHATGEIAMTAERDWRYAIALGPCQTCGCDRYDPRTP